MTEYGNQFAPPPSHPAAPGPTYGRPTYPPAAPGYPTSAPGYQPPAPGYPPTAPGYPAVPPVPTAYGAPTNQGAPTYQGSSMGPACRLCGSVPAAAVTFRQHTGMILMMRFGSLKGPFCRDCGIYVYRKMTAHTLLAGWWGWASFFITPITLLLNLARRGTVARLAPPIQRLANQRPADPGKPLYQRFAIVGLLVPLLVVGVIVAVSASSSSGDDSLVGRCVQANSAGTNAKLVDCGQPHQGVVTQVANTSKDCPSDSLFFLTHGDESSGTSVLCVGRG
jgi:hypothetical protein